MIDLFPADIKDLSLRLKELCLDGKVKIALAESCTGGLIGGAVTEIAGSSAYFQGTAGTYSNEAKEKILFVSPEVIAKHGAVSSECAEAMAEGALKLYEANMVISVTGVAGPDGGSEEKPVGTVWFGIAGTGRSPSSFRKNFSGERSTIRMETVRVALKTLISELGGV